MDDFDVAALGRALDARRTELGLSWKELSVEATDRPNRRSTRRIAPSTFQGIGRRRVGRDTVVLQALRWLRRTPESFIPGQPDDAGRLVPDDDDGRPELDREATFAALDAKRTAEARSWAEVADLVGGGFTAAKLRGLADGPNLVFPQAVRLYRWLDRPVADYVHFVSDG